MASLAVESAYQRIARCSTSTMNGLTSSGLVRPTRDTPLHSERSLSRKVSSSGRLPFKYWDWQRRVSEGHRSGPFIASERRTSTEFRPPRGPLTWLQARPRSCPSRTEASSGFPPPTSLPEIRLRHPGGFPVEQG